MTSLKDALEEALDLIDEALKNGNWNCDCLSKKKHEIKDKANEIKRLLENGALK